MNRVEGERQYRRLSPLTPLARSGILVAAVVATTWDDLLRGDVGPFAWILLGLLVAGAVYGAASWLLTKYWIESDELRVDTGVLNRQSRRIRIDRLQGVDVVQPFVARLLGLAELRMDVAGGSAREGSLAFLTLRDAHALRDLLLARREQVRAERQDATEAVGDPTAAGPAPSRPELPLARVHPGQLLAGLALLPETLLPVMATIAFAGASLAVGAWLPFTGLLPVLAGFALVQVRRLGGYYGFTVSETAAGLQVRRGLVSLSAQTIALPRVQGVLVTEPVLWRPLGWARLDVSIAGYGSGDDDEGPAASTVLPVGRRDVVIRLAHHVLAGLDTTDVQITRPPERARWVAPVGRHFAWAGIGRQVVVAREGWLTCRTHVVPHARVQSLRLTQGPLQRRLGLADLHVDSPPGPVRLRARDRSADEARRLLEQEVVASAEARSSRRPLR